MELIWLHQNINYQETIPKLTKKEINKLSKTKKKDYLAKVRREKKREKELQQANKLFSESQAETLIELLQKETSLKDCFRDYKNLAHFPEIYDLAITKINEFKKANVYSAKPFSRNLMRTLDLIEIQPVLKNKEPTIKINPAVPDDKLEDYINLEIEIAKNAKQISKGASKESGGGTEKDITHRATKALSKFRKIFAKDADELNITDKLLDSCLSFYSNANEACMKIRKEGREPISHYAEYVTELITAIRPIQNKDLEEYLWKWCDKLTKSPLKKYSLMLIKNTKDIIKPLSSDSPDSFEKWYTEIKDKILNIEFDDRDKIDDIDKKEILIFCINYCFGDAEKLPDNLSDFIDMELRSLTNYKNSKGRRRKRFSVGEAVSSLREAFHKAVKMDITDKLMDLGKKFHSQANAAYYKKNTPNYRDPLGTYLKNIAQIIEEVRFSKEDSTEEYLWKWFNQIMAYPAKEIIVPLTGQAATLLHESAKPDRFKKWEDIIEYLIKNNVTIEDKKKSVSKFTSQFGKLEDYLLDPISKIIKSKNYKFIKGHEDLFLNTILRFQKDVNLSELQGIWDISCSFNPDDKSYNNFKKILEKYTKLPVEQRAFAIEKTREYIKKVQPSFSHQVTEFIDSIPELFKKGSEGTDNYIGGFAEDSKSTKKTISLEKVVSFSKAKQVMHDYAHALCRRPIAMKKFEAGFPVIPFTYDGETIYLPSQVGFLDSELLNFKFYKVLTSYQCGIIEFGTLDCNLEKVLENLDLKFEEEAQTIGDLLQAFPNSDLAANLFYFAEITRIGSRLRETYPGLEEYMDIAGNAFLEKAPPVGDEVDKLNLLLRALTQYSVAKKTSLTLHPDIEEIYKKITKQLKQLENTSTTVEDSLILSYNLCDIFSKANLDADIAIPLVGEQLAFLKEIPLGSDKTVIVEQEEAEKEPVEGIRFKYDEWDSETNSYKENEVTVVETILEARSRRFIDNFYETNQGTITSVKEHFQKIKPQEIEVVHEQISGEIDYDAVVRARADMNAGIDPSDKVYTRTFKNNRSVVVALLADLSGSTGDFIEDSDLRPLDFIRQALVYYSIGVGTLDDPFGIFLYSGQTKDEVCFYKLKNFDEEFSKEIETRISSLRPQTNNRDGAGIRHATRLLKQQSYKTKLLLYLTDFKPKDEGYEGAYALQDTKMALQEATISGVYPCILVTGNDLSDPVYKDQTMKNIRHVVISEPKRLPLTVPEVYLRLTRG
ncbi:hypothetical protein KY332_03580 [Candidatus Woesearchaeota archaeon]|nr:hypothetical protein [Candidatus Woesearchaeota archaeon]